MKRIELIKKIQKADRKEHTQDDINAMIEALEIATKELLLEGNDVVIPGIGKIKARTIPEHTGTIMLGEHKGEKWVKPAHKEASIKIASSLKNVFEE